MYSLQGWSNGSTSNVSPWRPLKAITNEGILTTDIKCTFVNCSVDYVTGSWRTCSECLRNFFIFSCRYCRPRCDQAKDSVLPKISSRCVASGTKLAQRLVSVASPITLYRYWQPLCLITIAHFAWVVPCGGCHQQFALTFLTGLFLSLGRFEFW